MDEEQALEIIGDYVAKHRKEEPELCEAWEVISKALCDDSEREMELMYGKDWMKQLAK